LFTGDERDAEPRGQVRQVIGAERGQGHLEQPGRFF
jgi:hypothetical protein